jgi:8-oxo-dGTP pyrophosphatase MutT (NUDIX family)
MHELEHAKLPLWDSKSENEKMEILKGMVLDLYVYTLSEPMDNITAILDNHVPADQKETDDIKLIRKLMVENPNLMNRNCENGHFTGSALVIDVENKKFLLHLHKKLNRWFQFGGHPDYETDISEIALRESIEETGLEDLHFYPTSHHVRPIDIDVHVIPERKGEPEHPHLDFRYLLATNHPNDLFEEQENESANFQWYSFNNAEKVEELVDPALYRLILKARNLLEAKS